MRAKIGIALLSLAFLVAGVAVAAVVRSGGSKTVTSTQTQVVTAPDTGVTVTLNQGSGNASLFYAVTLHWSGITFPSQTGYFVYKNGTQIGDTTATTFVVDSLNCATTYTLGVAAHNGSGGTSPVQNTNYTTPNCPTTGPFPLQVSSNGRFLEDSSGHPWLMVGDSPQSVMGNLSEANASAYFADRETNGFNTIWINLLCDDYTGCASNGQTADSVKPFTSGTTPSTYDFGASAANANSTYFTRAHDMISAAKADNLEVILDPIETGGCVSGGWITTLENNGDGTVSTTDKDYQYGQFLGTEFGDLNNIIWMSGNDFQCITTTADKNDALSVANGIHNTDPSALQTLETDFNTGGNAGVGSTSLTSTSGASTGWSSRANLNAAYTYAPTYDEVRTAYGQSSSLPVFMGEANYEGQKNAASVDGCGAGAASDPTARNCRLQEWWTMTSGATGQLYGGPCYGITNSTTLSSCDTTGVSELEAQTDFLDTIDWSSLVPDTAGHVVTSGGGSCPSTGSLETQTCVTTAADDVAASSGAATLSLSYLPDPSTFASPVVNLADFAGPVTARWLDPTNGSFTAISGSPFANSGTHTFTPSTNNSAGDKDWVLVLQDSSGGAQSTDCAPASADTMTNTVSHLCGFADTTNTGPPPGTTLVAVPGSITAPTAATGSGWSYSGGAITVPAGAVLKDVTINGVAVITGANATVEDSEFDAADGNGTGVIQLRNASNATIVNNDIHGDGVNPPDGCDNGIRDVLGDSMNMTVENNNIWFCAAGLNNIVNGGTIENNYIHDFGFVTSGDHLDGIQFEDSTVGEPTLVQDNTILMPQGQTSPLILSNDDGGTEQNRTLNHNLLAGGGYCFYGAGGATASATGIVFTNNHFSPLYFSTCGQFGTETNIQPGTVVSGNVWDDTGAPA